MQDNFPHVSLPNSKKIGERYEVKFGDILSNQIDAANLPNIIKGARFDHEDPETILREQVHALLETIAHLNVQLKKQRQAAAAECGRADFWKSMYKQATNTKKEGHQK